MPITYYVTVTFDRDENGTLKPGEAMEAPNESVARRRAGSLADAHAGVIAFSRTGDPTTGEFTEAVTLATFGEVDLEALGA